MLFRSLQEGRDQPRGGAGAGLDAAASTHWVCEGLFGYLSHAAITELARATAGACGPGSTLVGNHVLYAWSVESLLSAFAGSGWTASAGPRLDALHRELLGEPVPEGGENYAMFEARK